MKKNIKIISATFIAMMLVISACKNDDVIIISKDLTVNFDQNSYNLPENGDPVVATLISKESYADKTIEIKVEGSAVYGTDYTTVPEVVDGVMTIEVAKGQSEYTVTISPIDNFIVNDERNMTFTLQSTDEIEAGEESTLTVTMSDDEVPGLTELFEGFEGGTVNDPVTGVNWINYAEAGTRTYVYKAFSGNQFAEFNPFSSGEDENVGWLVTPRIAMDEVAFKEMSLWSQRRFRDGEQLSILYSSDFTGISTDITTATWTSLSYTAPSVNDTWIETGAIDLSALTGDVFFAFKYVGSGNNNTLDGTWRIDNLRIGLETPSINLSTTNIADFGTVNNGETSGETTFTIQGTNTGGNVTITAPSNFEVSLSSGSEFASSIDVDVSTIQTIYVRFVPTSGTNGSKTGNIILSCANLVNRTIAVSGTEDGNAVTIGLLEENFDYGSSNGPMRVVSGGNWSNHSGTFDTFGYINSGLSMTGYAASGVGGAAFVDASQPEDINRTFAVQSSGAFYAGMLVNVSSANTSGTYVLHYKDASFGFVGRVFVKDDGGGNLLFGLSNSSTGIYSTTLFSYNTTYFVVLKFNADTGQSDLFVMNSVPGSEPSAEISTGAGTAKTDVQAIGIRQGGQGINLIVDGIIVTTDWADFIP